MKKFVWGLILAALGLVSIIGSENTDGGVGGLMLLGGGVLAYFGWQGLQKYKRTVEVALKMMRENGKIDAAELAQRIGVSEVDVHSYIAEAKRNGIIHFKTEIV